MGPIRAQTNLDTSINPNNFKAALLAQGIFEASNAVRDSLGFAPLKFDSILQVAAQYQAQRMLKEKSLQHRWRGDRSYGNLWKRLKSFKGQFKASGENIARNFILKIESDRLYYINDEGKAVDEQGDLLPNKTYRELGQEVVMKWLNSPGHRANLLGDFDYLGVGVSELLPHKKGPNFDVYLCQNFGTKWKSYLFSF